MHGWQAVELRGATGAERQRGQVHVEDGGYLGGIYRLVAGILAGNHIQAPRKGPITPQVAHFSVIIPNPEDNDLG